MNIKEGDIFKKSLDGVDFAVKKIVNDMARPPLIKEETNLMFEKNEVKMTKRYRVLVMDNNEKIVDILTRFLSQKYDVVTAYKGLDGLKAFEAYKGDIDVVITDLVLPEISGLGVISFIKKKYPTTPVIAITGWGEDPVTLAMEANADVALNKPFDLVDLDRQVTGLLGEKG
jgi:DNA-binding response OmpR family regulator